MTGHQGVCARVYTTVFVINLVLNILFIPRVSLAGAAMATSLAVCFEAFFLHLAVHQTLGVRMFIWRPGRAQDQSADAGEPEPSSADSPDEERQP